MHLETIHGILRPSHEWPEQSSGRMRERGKHDSQEADQLQDCTQLFSQVSRTALSRAATQYIFTVLAD